MKEWSEEHSFCINGSLVRVWGALSSWNTVRGCLIKTICFEIALKARGRLKMVCWVREKFSLMLHFDVALGRKREWVKTRKKINK